MLFGIQLTLSDKIVARQRLHKIEEVDESNDPSEAIPAVRREGLRKRTDTKKEETVNGIIHELPLLLANSLKITS